MGTMKRLLEISLIPKTSWYQNVRSEVPDALWKEIRALCLKKQCQYCGFKGALFLHEVWSYDDVNHVQKLTGFETVCLLCHQIKHLGLAEIMAEEGRIDYQELVDHYCRVNECTRQDFNYDRMVTFEVWEERSKYVWILDMSYLSGEVMSKLGGVHTWMKEHPGEVARIRTKLESS